MKKLMSLILVVSLSLTICGCATTPDGLDSAEIEIIYLDETTNSEASGLAEGENSSLRDEPVSSTFDIEASEDIQSQQVVIDYESAFAVDLCDDVVRGYLDSSTPQKQYAMLSSYSNTLHDKQNLKLSWNANGSLEYTVYVSESKDFSNSLVFKTDKTFLEPGILVPGKTYYWKVLGQSSENAISGGKIEVKNAPVRFVDIDGVGNFRDMGGWTTESGKTVKYEKLYRGRQLNDITNSGIDNLNRIGIKTEIDIRSDKNTPSEMSETGLNYNYFNSPDTVFMYHRIFKVENKEPVATNYKAIFALLADESNYPVYIHCSAGADRTGTLAFLINGYLGVSYEDLTRDFELTSFSKSGKRWRGSGTGGTFGENDTKMSGELEYVAWGELYKEMMNNYGTEDRKLSSAIENYLVNYVGVEVAHLESMKQIMLE